MDIVNYRQVRKGFTEKMHLKGRMGANREFQEGITSTKSVMHKTA